MNRRIALGAVMIAAVTSVACNARMAPASHTGVCVHLSNPYSEYDCPDVLLAASFFPQAAATPLPLDQIASVTLEVKTKSGNVHRYKMPDNTDAIFLGKRVTRDVFVHYYSTTNQKGKADALSREIDPWP